MSKYTPFLKMKNSEISALTELKKEYQNLVPFFDFPKRDIKKTRDVTAVIKTKEELLLDSADSCSSRVNKKLSWLTEFYLDNFDIEDNLLPNGLYNYQIIIDNFAQLGMIPVFGVDRSEKHIDCIISNAKKGVFVHDRIALRITKDDFFSFNIIQDDIKDLFDAFDGLFDKVDLVLDCRVVKVGEENKLAGEIINFINDSSKYFDFNKIIITGSMLPASITTLMQPNTFIDTERTELSVFRAVSSHYNHLDVSCGDYTCVTPEYSDPDMFVEDMNNIMTAKLIYPYLDRVYIERGGKVKVDKTQYVRIAKKIVSSPFYRQSSFSWGDHYLFKQSNGTGPNATPASVVKPQINLHISFMMSYL
ncbi:MULTISPECIES: hypothetical protein [unclassified Pseudoalteromonas]|uniref:beta family protein n=1 Tax=unclassified Pseudoalteromonas TaxID=194690 RepID=UPI0025B4AFF3|nr:MULTISPECIES: hypothetical protein [unclassified Pseudoalteromonas]MDN3379318.1 hypothetical protein [Pseudoalteromonas sp. APC 3893]MDN3386492.1 hypothetical protein [Pseudoalteromonas sp. APC 4017]